MDKINIIEYSDRHAEEWGSFLRKHESATYFFSLDYKNLIEKTYRIKTKYLLFYNASETLVGVLPLFVKSGRSLVSLPFSQWGGILCENEYLHGIEKALSDRYAGSNIEMRYNFAHNCSIFRKEDIGENTLLDMGSVDDNYLKKVDRSVRKNLKTAHKQGISIDIVPQPHRYVRQFYEIYRINEKINHGSPYHPFKYFDSLFNQKDVILAVAKKDGEIAGTLLGMANSTWTTFLLDGLTTKKAYLHTRFVDLLHYELIIWCMKRNFKVFDFGIARYEGQKRYKKKWGTEFRPYSIYYNNELSYKDPDAHVYRLFSYLWKNWTPLFMSDFLSFHMRRHLLQ